MTRPRNLLRALALLVLGLVVAAMGILAWRTDVRGLRRRLVSELEARAAARYPRPVHATPVVPGRFGTLADEAWTALAAQQGRSTDVEFCRAVRDGEEPFERAPPGCLRELEQGGAALSALLRATHAEEAGPPPGLGSIDLPEPEDRPRTWVTAAYAAKMGGLRLRAELARGEAEAALGTCLDLLALARDASWGTGLAGRLAALTVSQVAFGPCAAALDAAPVAAKRRAGEALAKVGEGTPPLTETLSDWSVAVRAEAFAPYLGAALPGLPVAVQRWAWVGPAYKRPDLADAMALGDAWHRLQARLDRVVDAGRLPPAEAVERLTAMGGLEQRWSNTLGRAAFPELGRVAMSDARVRAQLLLLRRAAAVDALRAETGKWPKVDALGPELRSTAERPLYIEDRGAEALVADPSAPRGGLELTLHADR